MNKEIMERRTRENGLAFVLSKIWRWHERPPGSLTLGAKFICNNCKKQLELDDICYCKDAKTKCHCNSRNCCTLTLKERGNFT
uniref:DUF3795 domain-containing protein n=1 Tax=Globodera pallida TaxID=36090 RepID=A0A183BMX2_GLOPA